MDEKVTTKSPGMPPDEMEWNGICPYCNCTFVCYASYGTVVDAGPGIYWWRLKVRCPESQCRQEIDVFRRNEEALEARKRSRWSWLKFWEWW